MSRTRRALCIGIEKYKNAPPLKGCANDAAQVFKLLESHADDEETPNFTCEYFTDEQIPTKGELHTRVEKLFADSHEVALFYFSGHGTFANTGSYLVTPDYAPNDKGYPIADLMELAAQSKSDTKIIILDCCYAGAAGKFIRHANDNLLSEDTILLASCRPDQTSAMINGHSIFTSLLIQALKGGGADLLGNISPASVYAYIDQSLSALEQRPVFKAVVDHFISLRKVKPLIPLRMLRAITTLFPDPGKKMALDKTYIKEADGYVPEHVEKFDILKRLNRVGLVVPCEGHDMYWAAMNEYGCELTPLGMHYHYRRIHKLL